MKRRICYSCGNENVVRKGNVFIPGEGNFAVYQCAGRCGDIWHVKIYDIDDTQEMAVVIPPDELKNVNQTFER